MCCQVGGSAALENKHLLLRFFQLWSVMLSVFADRSKRADDEGALCSSGIQQLASGQWGRALDALTALLSRLLDAPGKNPAAKILFSRALPHFFWGPLGENST